MAIINCPECGHKISDRAPVCPSCGVEIANKTTACPECGRLMLVDYAECPYCGHRKSGTKDVRSDASTKQVPILPKTNSALGSQGSKSQKKQKQTKSRLSKYFYLFFFIALSIAAGVYLYQRNLNEKEQLAFEKAVNSNDITRLRSFLNNYPNASEQHVDSILKLLDVLYSIDEEWENVKMMRAKIPLQDYLAKYPETKHKGEIENMLDSIDWQVAVKSNNTDVYQQYVETHPYGKYADDAREKINFLKAKIVSPEERDMIARLMRQFFLSVNMRDEGKLISSLSQQMTLFLGVVNPTENDVKQWMHRQYKEDVSEIIWRLAGDYVISKREVGNNAYEYTVKFSASEDIKRLETEKSSTENYSITAQVTPDGLLSAMSIAKK